MGVTGKPHSAKQCRAAVMDAQVKLGDDSLNQQTITVILRHQLDAAARSLRSQSREMGEWWGDSFVLSRVRRVTHQLGLEKMYLMRGIYVIIPLLALLASPAFAQSARQAKAQRAAPVRMHDAPVARPRFGTDPDPNVQFEIMRQQNWRKGGS